MQYKDLHDILRFLALGSGVTIVTNALVTSILPPNFGSHVNDISLKAEFDPSRPSIQLATGEFHQADIVIGADGQRSIVRQLIEKIPPPIISKLVVYNGLIPNETVMGDERLKDVVEIKLPLWMGNNDYAHSKPFLSLVQNAVPEFLCHYRQLTPLYVLLSRHYVRKQS